LASLFLHEDTKQEKLHKGVGMLRQCFDSPCLVVREDTNHSGNASTSSA
jgi:hypothetical protein